MMRLYSIITTELQHLRLGKSGTFPTFVSVFDLIEIPALLSPFLVFIKDSKYQSLFWVFMVVQN